MTLLLLQSGPGRSGGGVAATAPVNTVLPAIGGTTTVGSTLTTTDGTWTGSPAPTYTYQWKRGGTNISGATASTYLLVTADIAATITATVTATNTAGNASATATGVGPVTSPYATWDAATVANVTLSGGNLAATNTATSQSNSGARVADASGKSTGKFYFEATLTNFLSGGGIGTGVGTTASTYAAMANNSTVGACVFFGSGNIYSNGTNTGSSLGAKATGDVIAVAVDLDNRKAWFKKVSGTPGNWNNSGTANPATNVGGIVVPAGVMVPFSTFGSTNVTANAVTTNFGASAFTGAVPSGFTSGWA